MKDSEDNQIDNRGGDKKTSDHTRISVHKNPSVNLDKTRIAPDSKATTASDATQFKPVAKKPAPDATQIKPNDNRSDATQFKPVVKKHGADTTQFKSKQKKDLAQTGQAFKTIPPKKNNHSTEITVDQTNSDESENDILKQRFILEDVLGAGGMGVVYKAKDLVKVEAGDKDPYLAIKVLTDEFKQHPEAFVALQRESRKTQRIAHPNIVNVHDFDKDDDTVFMTMEYLEGKPLDQLIRQYKSTGLPSDDAMSILKHICRALIYAHDQEIIHSDFKPGNIFVTDKGVTKVFDFGIARAVAKAETYEIDSEDKTVFDAGDLGALTPSYASYEMLEGEEPDVRDDIYALGCVAYELFTGNHPFNKVPANEAKQQKLTPKKINHITRRQWKAIEKALSFEREERVPSVKEFLSLISKSGPSYKIPVAIALSLLTLTVTYFQFIYQAPVGISETEIRSEVEYKIRLENYRDAIDSLLISADFSSVWEDRLWQQIQGVRKLLETKENWLEVTTNVDFKHYLQNSSVWHKKVEENIFTLYWQQIKQVKASNELAQAISLIKSAYRYTQDSTMLDEEMSLLQLTMTQQKKEADTRRKQQLAQQAERNNNKLTAKKKQKPSPKNTKQVAQEQFLLALNNVQEQLKCQSNKLNMRHFNTAIQKLRSIDRRRYLKIEKELITALASCISYIGKSFPERAKELKKYSLRIFKKNQLLSSIIIVPRDPCDKSLAGLGARGKRAICKDVVDNAHGPRLVVIPGKKGIRTFALGKYEVSIAELNAFCKISSRCQENKMNNQHLPATGISLQTAESYLKWLSKKTKNKYRLPTKNEWLYAAKARQVNLDANRNCKLNTRGITKGDQVVRNTIGKQNGWGLVNYVGNASEWVYDKGRKLIAIGGAYNVPMEQCNITTLVIHNGKADRLTGFRVLRELKQ